MQGTFSLVLAAIHRCHFICGGKWDSAIIRRNLCFMHFAFYGCKRRAALSIIAHIAACPLKIEGYNSRKWPRNATITFLLLFDIRSFLPFSFFLFSSLIHGCEGASRSERNQCWSYFRRRHRHGGRRCRAIQTNATFTTRRDSLSPACHLIISSRCCTHTRSKFAVHVPASLLTK